MTPLDSNVELVGVRSVHARSSGGEKSEARTCGILKYAENTFVAWLREDTVPIDSEHFGSDSFAVAPLARIA
jgi:hypothetical protein